MLFAGLYFAEGAPIGFLWWALPVWLRSDGRSPGEIARLTAWLAWPWALKFLWAPLVDLVRGPRFGLRAWIVASQVGMALTLVPLLFLDFGADVDLLLWVLLLHAVTAATQDASIDTLAVRMLSPTERGAVNGWMQVGMLGARGLFGGGAVLLAAALGPGGRDAVVLLLVLSILSTAVLAWLGGRGSTGIERPRGERTAAYLAGLSDLLGRRELWIGFLYAAVAGAGFEGLASLAGPLLLDHGVAEESVGDLFLVPTVLAMGTGALLGGWASDRLGRRRVVLLGEGLAALTVVAVGAVVWTGGGNASRELLVALLLVLYLAAGIATAALYALLMELTRPAVAATQFCVFMAAINLCYVWSTRLLGELVDRLGYGPAIVAVGSVSVLALPAIGLLRPAATTPSLDGTDQIELEKSSKSPR